MKISTSIAAALAVALAGPAMGQETAALEMPESCEVTASSKLIRIVVCEEHGLPQDALIAAGKAACGAVLPCGTWIWDQPARAPVAAPDNHDGLTQDEITSSRGVWVAEDSSFIEIEQVD